MNNLIDSLAATTIAVVLVGALPNIAGASEKAPLDPVQVGRTDGLIVFAENGMAHGKKSDSDPNAFFIYKGNLYVCTTPGAKAEFTSNPDANISRADNNWLKIGPATYNSESHGFDEPWLFGPESNQQ